MRRILGLTTALLLYAGAVQAMPVADADAAASCGNGGEYICKNMVNWVCITPFCAITEMCEPGIGHCPA